MTLHLMGAGLKGQERAFDQRNRVISYVRFGGSRLNPALQLVACAQRHGVLLGLACGITKPTELGGCLVYVRASAILPLFCPTGLY
jgi:hypothetical protein